MSFALWFLFTSTLFTPVTHCDRARISNWFVEKTIPQLNHELTRLKSLPLEQRVEIWSKRFLSTPYGIDPAGEESGVDPDPLFNVCAVDCETYVEQVLALAFSSNMPQLWRWLELMRYEKGIRSFENRFYTMALQWIPGNLRLGYLTSAHARIGGKPVLMIKDIDPNFPWARPFLRRFRQMGKRSPRGKASLEYLPLKTLIERYKRIPIPSVGLVVGARQIRNPFLITHMGFILKNNEGKLIWRHASGTAHRRKVEDRLLIAYLKETDSYFKKHRRRHVKGLIIYTISEPKPPETLVK
ncbi:DUF1460 domain-containing protein [Myxococcota bacterium]|nr:DUF1460 domain-containing protein [Myxococcota bacterium]MBU1534235.1 DUF1460 domain-containing protein [Myxococcota bacterium]